MSRTQSRGLLLSLVVVMLSACGGSTSDQAAAPASAPGKAPSKAGGGLLSAFTAKTEPIAVPEGTVLSVTLETAIDSENNKSGEDFNASFAEPVVVGGKTVIPKGAAAKGVIVEAKESGRLKGRALLRLALNSVDVDGKTYDLKTANISLQGAAHTKRNATMIGGGAGVGAAIGAIAGGGKGAAIGAGIGAGAGTAGAAATGKKDVKLPAESALKFKLAEPVTVQVKTS